MLRSLYVQVLIAITFGIALGALAPETGAAMKPFGDGFIKLIKMIIAPIIFCTVVVGIAGTADMKKVGKTGGLALLYFEVVSTVALLVGLCVVNIIQPGAGMNIDAYGRLVTPDTAGSFTATGQKFTGQQVKNALGGAQLPGTTYDQSRAYVNYIRRLQAGQSGFTCYASLQMPR